MAATEKTWPEFLSEGRKAGKDKEQISKEWKELKAQSGNPPKLENTPPPPPSSEDEEEGGAVPPKLQSSTEPTPVVDKVEGDYLRKYQYRKQTAFGSVRSDPPAGSKAAAMKERLLKQPRVRIMIPREMNEDAGVKQSVTLNGYRLDLPKQQYVEVPEQIAEVLMESLNQTEAALNMNRIDGNKAKEAALL